MQQTVRQMNLSGERAVGAGWTNAALNNISRFSYDLGGPGRPYLGCGEQAGRLVSDLSSMDGFDDQWFFETDQFGAFHQVGVGYSSNPDDPILILDPWANKMTPLPRK